MGRHDTHLGIEHDVSSPVIPETDRRTTLEPPRRISRPEQIAKLKRGESLRKLIGRWEYPHQPGCGDIPTSAGGTELSQIDDALPNLVQDGFVKRDLAAAALEMDAAADGSGQT
jgi:hypothetical protein